MTEIKLIALVVALAGAFGWYRFQMHEAKQTGIAECQAKTAQAIEVANQKAQDAAGKYETWKAAQRPKTITITREVERAIHDDADCSAKSLPLSLRDALAKSLADSNQSDATSPMPSASSAAVGDLWGRATGLLGHPTGAARLSGAASSPD